MAQRKWFRHGGDEVEDARAKVDLEAAKVKAYQRAAQMRAASERLLVQTEQLREELHRVRVAP